MLIHNFRRSFIQRLNIGIQMKAVFRSIEFPRAIAVKEETCTIFTFMWQFIKYSF